MPMYRLVAIALVSAALVACAAPKPLVTSADIAAADSTGNLPALYNQVKAGMAGKDRSQKKFAAQFAQLDAIGRTLTNRLDEDLRKRMDGARLHNGIVPLAVLTEVAGEAEAMRNWQPARHDQLMREIQKNRDLAEKAIRDINTYIENLPPTAFRKKADALTQLALVTGDSKFSTQRDTMNRTLRGEFEQARATDDFEKALQLLDALPKDDQTEPLRAELTTRLAERKFNEALADDRPDEAYRYFDTLSQSAYFPDVKTRITPTANQMAEFFVALANNAVIEGRMSDAYRWFAQARDVHIKLDGSTSPVPEEKPFVDRIYRGHDRAKAEGLWGLALGYLQITHEFDPARANLARDLRTAYDEVGKIAIRSATVAPFSAAAGSADYSGAIATRITESLFAAIPNDVRIIAWDPARTSGIDYTISGSIDEARVETSQTTTRKTTRAVTEEGAMTRNPRYDEWLKLSERERRNTPQPAPQIPVDRKEDISYNVTQLRKVGYFSVAFRIIESASGKVVHTDSLTLKKELADEGNEGVELGSFRIPSKSPSLPTDIEILNKLANEASQEIGKRLAGRLGDLEKRYADAGKKSAANNSPVEAAQFYGMSVAVAKRKGQDAEAYNAELKKQAAAAGYAR
ncbi:MAG: hypothetical protein ACOY33_09675 [Pseudomonadota bacterium]